MIKILCLLVASLLLANALSDNRILIANRAPHPKWLMQDDVSSQEPISFKVLLKQQNVDKIEQYFWDVSNPKHESFGKFMTREQVSSMVASKPESIKQVMSWLVDSGVAATSIARFPDYLFVQTSVGVASKMFDAKFVRYSNSGNKLIRVLDEMSIPAYVSEHIDFVSGISELVTDSHHKPKYDPEVFAYSDEDGLVLPSVLNEYYDVPAGTVGTNSKNLQGIAAFTDYFSMGALKAFDQNQSISNVNIKRNGPSCFNTGECDQFESDLDAQYMTALGANVPTLFLAHGAGEWILDWAQQVASMSNPPLIHSISYGWAELEQCEITAGCQQYGYDSQQYVTRTNTELAKLGNMGLTVFVSDGDDGAPSLGGASGNCPIDTSSYCPTGGCAHTRSDCSEITFTLSNGTDCFFPMGVESNGCAVVLNEQAIQNAINKFAQANPSCNFAIENDRTQNPHWYSECECSAIKPATYEHITVSAYTYKQSNGAIFAPDYPTSSPFVTSVGATQFEWRNGQVTGEIGASIVTDSKITTGGGFSAFQPGLSFAQSAIQAYLSSNVALPPSYAYNASNRAYPDIAFNGHNYWIVASNNTGNLDECPCLGLPVDGTSCSSPSVAGLFSLINDALLNAGKSPLGPINNMLYQMAADAPDAFTDITSGNNRCNRSYCCLYGYEATEGWDPVSGLGSPVFSKTKAYILGLRGVKA